jgi:hypothetical protein
LKSKKRTGIREVAALIGVAVIISDIVDVGKIDRFHHWQLGAGILFVSLLA